MTGSVEFVYDLVSTPCHIAWKSLDSMVRSIGTEVVMTPVLVAGIFKAIDNPGPLAVAAKREWYARDLALWANRRGVALAPSPYIPIRSLPLMRGCIVAAERNETFRYVDTMFDAIYVHGRNLSDMIVVEETLRAAGLDAAAYLQGIGREEVKRQLLHNTEQAIARRVFGVPTFFVRDELFFGQDRLEFVVEALQRG